MQVGSRWHGVVVRPDDALLAHHAGLFGATPADRLHALAQGLATSPAWHAMRERLRIVVRHAPRPVLGVIGDPEDADRSLLNALGWQVTDALHRLRPISYEDAEAACSTLAASIRRALGPSRVRTARFVGLPRGGLVVVGMLSYFLELEAWQLSSAPTSDHPIVLVDDCISGGSAIRARQTDSRMRMPAE